MAGYSGSGGSGLSFIGSHDSGEKALGVSVGDDIVAAALVKKTGMSRLWLFVKEGSGAMNHVPHYSDVRQHILPFGVGFDFPRALTSIQAQCGVARVGNGASKAKRNLAWSFAQRNEFGFYGPMAGLARYYWEAAEHETKKTGAWNWLRSLIVSSDDLTVIDAICNGLVALGVADEEELRQKREAREEELEQIHSGETVTADWPWIRYKGKHIRIAPDAAKELVEIGAATYL
jgi:hypothetical protein